MPGSTTLNPGTGVFGWTPGYDDADTYTVNYTASDGSLQDVVANTITVNHVNRPPVINPLIPGQTVDKSGIVNFTIQANDPDGDPIEYSHTSTPALPDGATLGATDGVFDWQTGDIKIDHYNNASFVKFGYPGISPDENGHVYAIWYDGRIRGGNSSIYLNYSNDHGRPGTWQTTDIRLDTDGAGATKSGPPKISSDENGHVYVT